MNRCARFGAYAYTAQYPLHNCLCTPLYRGPSILCTSYRRSDHCRIYGIASIQEQQFHTKRIRRPFHRLQRLIDAVPRTSLLFLSLEPDKVHLVQIVQADRCNHNPYTPLHHACPCQSQVDQKITTTSSFTIWVYYAISIFIMLFQVSVKSSLPH